MIKRKKSLIINIVLTGLLIIFARALRLMINDMESVILPTFLIFLRGMIHLSLALIWTISVYHRITNKQARRLFLSIGILMLVWIVVKTAKYEFFPNNTDTLVRYLWYAFYIPMLLIPLIGIFVAQYIRKPDDYRLPRWVYLFFIPALLLLLSIFTNDLHNLVFTFPEGIENFDSKYSYGILYWCAMAWYVSLTLAFVIILICKSRLPDGKKVQKIPLVIALLSVSFWILYTAGLINGDLTVIDCLIIVTLLETSIQTGLIPTNTNHKELFTSTTVPVIIVDNSYQARYTSGGASHVSEEDMMAAEGAAVTIGETMLHSAPITGGRVVWQIDVSALNDQKRELDDIRQALSEESVLIEAENEIRKKQTEADEKNKIYDKIARDTKPQLDTLAVLIEKAKNGEDTKRNLAHIAVIGSYVKRCGNLLLLAAENKSIPSEELARSLRESIDNLKLLDIDAAIDEKGSGNIPLENAVRAFCLYEAAIEPVLDRMSAIYVRLFVNNVGFRLSLQLGVDDDVSEADFSRLLECEDVSIELDDGTLYVDVSMGGESKL